MDVVVDSKGTGTYIRFDNASDAAAMEVWAAFMNAEINGCGASGKYNGMFFDQPIIFTGEFTSGIFHTGAVENGAGSDPYRIFKVTALRIGFPFSRLRYPKGSRDDERAVLETHFGFETLFPKGIKYDGKKLDLSKYKREPKKSEQDGTGQPATRPESKPEGGDKPQPESEMRSR